jgi:hypothetical protein
MLRKNALGTSLLLALIPLTYTAAGWCCVPPPPGMVSWWPGDGNANDIKGTNNGTPQGGVTFPPGEVAEAFGLNGVNQFVEIADNPGSGLSGMGAITLDAWILLTDISTPHLIVSKYNTAGGLPGTESYYFGVNPNGSSAEIEFVVYGTPSGNSLTYTGGQTTNAQLTPNTWYHVAGTWDGTTTHIYVNGADQPFAPITSGTVTNVRDTTGEPVRIGAVKSLTTHGIGYFFAGLIDEVEIFNRALTPVEVAAIFAAGSAGKCKSPPPPTEFPIHASGFKFGATEGVSFGGSVAMFTDPDPNSMATEYTATIDWGDSSTSAGTITGPTGGPFTVSGTHTYAEEGTYTVTVTIRDVDNAQNNATAISSAIVGDGKLSSSCATLPASPQTYTGPTAAFTDQSGTGTLSDFSATIDWGDSSTSAGTITGGPGNAPYTVSGTHTYGSTGTFLITTSIKDVGGSSTTTPACSVTIFAFATTKGAAFVIGDLEAGLGNHVTWWSSQWANINLMSGGAPPNAMKGFAGFEDNFLGLPPPNCGGTWSTDPGNSTPPPPSVPQYMGVIVSSQVTQAGSIISGDIKQVVVVRNDPGYAPDPGHSGTGTEMAIVCMKP